MNPPPATIAPLDYDVASSSSAATNEVIPAGNDKAAEGRTTVYVSSVVEITQATDASYDVEEDSIDYRAAAGVLARAEPIDDEVETPYRSPFE